MKGKKQLHFGVLFSNLDNSCQGDIWYGIVDYANDHNIHLTAYIGSYQTTNYDIASHFDTCFEIIKESSSLDGLIIFSGFIASSVGNENFDDYAAEIPEHIPRVSVSYIIPGVTSILADNTCGMYSVVEHVIKAHGKRHIAFVRGPEGHPEAEDRLEGYRMALEANGIAYDERYIFPGNFSSEAGVLAVKSLLSSPDISADAIVACDDTTATGVLTELINQGLHVPDDITVAGFDDDRDSASFTPSISTARQDFFEIGLISAKALHDQINGEPTEDVIYLSPDFIPRQSCGCTEDELSGSELRYEDYLAVVKEAKSKEFTLLDNMVMLRRIASNLVVELDIDSLVGEMHKSLPELSIDSAIMYLYSNSIKSGDPNADRTIDMIIGYDGETRINVKSSSSNPIQYSDYSAIEGFGFDSRRHDLFLMPLFFRDEEYGIILMPFVPDISVNVYETLRVNISTAVKGANLIKELEHHNALLIKASNAKSEFLSTMSHEMRTPMNAIIGMTVIGKRAKDLEEKDYTLRKIEDASSHLLDVINDVLDMAKIEANELVLSPVEFNFDRMLHSVIAVINYRAEEKQQTLSVNIDSDIPRFVTGDDKRLSQVLTNLMSNAVKFTPAGGKVKLDVSLLCKHEGVCELRVEVADDGIGISPEQQANLFQAFKQAESGTSRMYGGTGLGLVISKNIIDLMGGKIWIESELNKGAKFIFTIKVLCGEDNNDSLLVSGVNWENVHILVVDDTRETQKLFRTFFRKIDVKCDLASDYNDACRFINEHGCYDIYFIDWRTPGTDVVELMRNIKSCRKEKSFVVTMISEMDWEQVKAEASQGGVDKHIMKPIFSSTIIDCINECFGSIYAQNEGENPEQNTFAGKRVLLAEDIEINREIFISLMADTGLIIDCAFNGKEAFDMVEAAPDKYDIVFMDVQMPQMSGYEATRLIRALPALQDVKLPIVAMTANVFKSDIEDSIAAGMDGHLGKPLDIDKVFQVLRKYL